MASVSVCGAAGSNTGRAALLLRNGLALPNTFAHVFSVTLVFPPPQMYSRKCIREVGSTLRIHLRKVGLTLQMYSGY